MYLWHQPILNHCREVSLGCKGMSHKVIPFLAARIPKATMHKNQEWQIPGVNWRIEIIVLAWMRTITHIPRYNPRGILWHQQVENGKWPDGIRHTNQRHRSEQNTNGDDQYAKQLFQNSPRQDLNLGGYTAWPKKQWCPEPESNQRHADFQRGWEMFQVDASCFKP
jgi:hypothetical protein